MSTELQGFDDLIHDLTNMAAALDNGPVVNAALKAGAAPVEQQMRHNASTDPAIVTGDLRSSIRVGTIKGGAKGKRITIGVHHKEKGAFYANPVEFGHGGPAPAPAHPFVRPAFDTRSEEAYGEMKKVLGDALDRR